MNQVTTRRMFCLGAMWAALAGWSSFAYAVFSCTVSTPTSSQLQYPADITGVATLNCSRGSNDGDTLSYQLRADNGLNTSGTSPYRRVRKGNPTTYLFYSLQRNTNTPTATATCGSTTNWRSSTYHSGVLVFGSAMQASTTLGYCIRVGVNVGGNQLLPAAGVYTDTLNIYARYRRKGDSGAWLESPVSSVNLSVNVNHQCVFNTYPGNLNFNYTAFSATAQEVFTHFVLRCSTGSSWTITVEPATTTLLGLHYQIKPSPSGSTANGNTGQHVTLTGTMPAGQAGTCAAHVCTGSQPHTVYINY